jgi:mannose-6-phosphate isomerase
LSLIVELSPLPVGRPWGGQRAARHFGWPQPAGPQAIGAGEQAIGEWWLASCQPGAISRLAPPAKGNLEALLATAGRDEGLPPAADFPLLVKFLDCAEALSVQVHPDDETARAQGLPRGKTEAWHVLAAEPEAAVWLGTAPGVSAARLLDRVAAGAGDDEVRALLRRVPVRAGDTLVVRGGTVHAIGPGLLLYEVQQNSDTTWRIHDWGRGRPVHLKEARQAALDHPPESPRRAEKRAGWTELARMAAFGLRAARVAGELDVAAHGPFALITALSGSGTIATGGRELALRPGTTALLAGSARLSGADLSVLCTDAPA